eukprot:1709119-Pleurochrysis_carterae.AAC.1
MPRLVRVRCLCSRACASPFSGPHASVSAGWPSASHAVAWRGERGPAGHGWVGREVRDGGEGRRGVGVARAS